MNHTIQLTDEELKLISRLIYKKFGILLSEKKRNLIIGRLQKILRTGGFKSFKEYYDYVVRDLSGKALLTMVDQISTNHTFFFREKQHFDFFTSVVLPQLCLKNRTQKINIWCAGCSSGEEPYSLAIALYDFFGADIVSAGDIGILATDISISALKRALAGVYPESAMAQMPLAFRQKYFTPEKDGCWAVSRKLKEIVLFRRLNLVQGEYPFKGKFQAIFCRNVMIYFDSVVQQAVVERFYRYTEPGGYLFVGHSESLNRIKCLYKYVKPSIYQKGNSRRG